MKVRGRPRLALHYCEGIMKYVKQTGYREQRAQKQQRQRARQKDKQPVADRGHLLGKVHINNGEKALCRNKGEFLSLVSRDEFEKTEPAGRCLTCERLAGLKPGASEVDTLSEKQKALLGETAADKWCLVMYLCSDNYRPNSTSMYRSLRRLERRGYIEKRLNEQKRAEVKLVPDRVHVLDSGRIVIRQKQRAGEL